MSQDELYQWVTDQEANTPPDEAEQFVENVVNRMEYGSWKALMDFLAKGTWPSVDKEND